MKGSRNVAAIFLLAWLGFVGVAHSEPLIDQSNDPALRAAINNAHHDMATCFAFYTISIEAFRRRREASAEAKAQTDATIAHTQNVNERLAQVMLQLHHPDVTKARIRLAVEEQLREMREDFSNYSLLLAKHLRPCKEISEGTRAHVEKRFAEELAKE